MTSNIPLENQNIGRSRVVIETVSPEIDGGRYPIKRVVGEKIVVEADIFADGHDRLSAVLLSRQAGEGEWTGTRLTRLSNGRWRGGFEVTCIGEASWEIFKRDAADYGCSYLGHSGGLDAPPLPWHDQSHLLNVTLPPLAAVAFKSTSGVTA